MGGGEGTCLQLYWLVSCDMGLAFVNPWHVLLVWLFRVRFGGDSFAYQSKVLFSISILFPKSD